MPSLTTKPTSRALKAKWLLGIFFAGSLMAPLSHYVFMVVSDMYAFGGGQHHHERSHHDGDEPAFSSSALPQFVCTYADLFATFDASDLRDQGTSQVWDITFIRALAPQSPALPERTGLPLTRAPPLA